MSGTGAQLRREARQLVSWVRAAGPWKIAHFAVLFLVVACVTVAPIVALCRLPGRGKYSGEWVGQTRWGTPIAFLVHRGEIIGFSAGFCTEEETTRQLCGRLGGPPSAWGRVEEDGSFSARVDGGTFDGRFGSEKSATGTYTVHGRTVPWTAEWDNGGDFSD